MRCRRWLLVAGLLLVVGAGRAEGLDSLSQSPRKGLVRRVADYFGQSTVDRTAERAIDFTFAGGPSYSKTTELGLGLLGSGLYRLDRQDSVTPPSDLSFYGTISTTGFYSLGATGNTIFRDRNRRLSYELSFTSSPRDLWGIGYEAGRTNPPTKILEQRYALEVQFRQRIVADAYLGALIDLDYRRGRDFDATADAYIHHQRREYLATGVGLLAEYDTRDFIPNPSRGVYLALQQILYARGLGNCSDSFWRTIFTADYYRQVWRGGVLAFDLYGELNSKGTPWTMLARLGGSARMRGYYEGQYADRNLVVGQVELRQHLWRRFGGVGWGGAGNVFPRMSSFRWAETLPNYGLGLRWELKKRVNVRMDYGFGRATSGFLLSINEAF